MKALGDSGKKKKNFLSTGRNFGKDPGLEVGDHLTGPVWLRGKESKRGKKAGQEIDIERKREGGKGEVV